MSDGGISERLVKLAMTLVGHLRGGLAHVNVVVGMFFAGISGSSTAEAAAIGAVFIPAMKRRGYDEKIRRVPDRLQLDHGRGDPAVDPDGDLRRDFRRLDRRAAARRGSLPAC